MRFSTPLMAATLAAVSGYVPGALAQSDPYYNRVIVQEHAYNHVVAESSPEKVVVQERVVVNDPYPASRTTVVRTTEYQTGADTLGFSQSDREYLRDYLAKHYNYCAPSARSGPACVPPMRTVFYDIGDRLPNYVAAEYIPLDLQRRLEPLPVGYRYAFVDKDLVIYNEDNRQIVDAIEVRALL